MTWRYTVPRLPESHNRYIGRTNFREYQASKRQWEGLIRSFCRPVPSEPLSRARVTLLYCFADRRRRDPDNYSGKMILDGLVRAGVLLDDSFQNIELSLAALFGCAERKTVIVVEEGA